MAYTPIINGDTGLAARGIINGIGASSDLHISKSGSDVHNLGTMATQNSNNVNITGGSLVGQYAKFGTNTDHTLFEEDGSMVFSGSATVWKDELGDVTKLKESGTGITESNTESAVGFETGMSYTSDYLYTNIQLNHDRKLSALIYPHIHFSQTTSSFPNFIALYRWQVNGQPKVTDWTPIPTTGGAFSYTSGELNQIALFAPLTPPALSDVSDVLQFRISRDKTNSSGLFAGQDTLNTTVYLTSFDVHYEVDTVGSRKEYVK